MRWFWIGVIWLLIINHLLVFVSEIKIRRREAQEGIFQNMTMDRFVIQNGISKMVKSLMMLIAIGTFLTWLIIIDVDNRPPVMTFRDYAMIAFIYGLFILIFIICWFVTLDAIRRKLSYNAGVFKEFALSKNPDQEFHIDEIKSVKITSYNIQFYAKKKISNLIIIAKKQKGFDLLFELFKREGLLSEDNKAVGKMVEEEKVFDEKEVASILMDDEKVVATRGNWKLALVLIGALCIYPFLVFDSVAELLEVAGDSRVIIIILPVILIIPVILELLLRRLTYDNSGFWIRNSLGRTSYFEYESIERVQVKNIRSSREIVTYHLYARGRKAAKIMASSDGVKDFMAKLSKHGIPFYDGKNFIENFDARKY